MRTMWTEAVKSGEEENNVRYFVTGGAGFIGSNMVDRLLGLGNEVVVYDNFSTGRREFLENAMKYDSFTLIEGDTLDQERLKQSMAGCEFVFHFAANADVRMGCEHPEKDLKQNTIATFHVLEAMRENGIKRIGFSSTGSVYGEAEVIPTPEDAPFPVQTSLYAASKLAGVIFFLSALYMFFALYYVLIIYAFRLPVNTHFANCHVLRTLSYTSYPEV